ncbi:CsbD family protein [Sphingomonas sp. 3P27F8]|uniref:CsbD family protein n=1 Tax=Sphingomonas sp. 3P27F8 TaxID=2502213 RepID=UPI0010F5A70D|nr:CsbD family protein [Sphingomonas sp. 3P27F8]
MNEDTIGGEGRDIIGKVKETAGDVSGNSSLQGEGLVDQLTGKAQKVIGAARDAVGPGGDALAQKATDFAKKRPFAVAALVGVLGVALINTLRGKR